MLIDWFTVGAQVLNFVVLVWLLKRFLYRPVLDAIDAREARIAGQIADATATQAAAASEQADFKRRNADFDGQRDALLKQATANAESERQRLAEAAREAADAALARRQDAQQREAASLRRTLADRTRTEVFAIARRVLRDLGDVEFDERVAAVFVRRLGALDPAVLTSLASALEAGAPRATVRTAFESSAQQREMLRGAVITALSPSRKDAAGSTIDVVFETAPDLLGGIELVVGGRKLGWNVSEYMDALERVLDPATPTTHPDDKSAVPADSAAGVPEAVA